MHEIPLNKILSLVVAVLVIGQALLFYQNAQLRAAAGRETSTSATATIPAPTSILVSFIGIATNSSSNTLTLSVGSSTRTIAVGNDTMIVREGVLKDPATYEADLEKFHQYSDQLMQDPQKNQHALQTLVAPSRNVETQIALSQITPGAKVIVFIDGQNADGSYRAVRIIVQ